MSGLPFCMNCLKLDVRTCYGDDKNDNKCDTCQQELVEIDEPLVPIIIKLNSKGYKTIYCCSGHTYNEHGYLAFDKNYRLPNPKTSLLRLESGWGEPNRIIRWTLGFIGDDYRFFSSAVNVIVKKLHDYIDKLPSIK